MVHQEKGFEFWKRKSTSKDESCELIGPVLASNSDLLHFDLSDNLNSVSRIYRNSKGLKNNRALQKLILEISKGGDKGCREICKAIENHPSLQLIDLRVNEITELEMVHIARVISINKILNEISFDDNRVGDSGADLLSYDFPDNSTLQHLWLTACHLGLEGFPKLADGLRESGLKENSTLEVLHLSHNTLENL